MERVDKMSGVCVVCGKPKNKKAFCSRKCYAVYRTQWKICVVCGKQFASAKSDKTKCCSRECSRLNRIEMGKSSVFKNNVIKMTAAKSKFYKSHNGEKDVNSKYWKIQSPAGEVFECQNLFHFIKTHPELFEGTTRQAMDGFSTIKASKLGKRKNPVSSWKGWKLLDWNDKRLAEINK